MKWGKKFLLGILLCPKEIAKFFFFDAEKIVSLAEIHTVEQRKKLSTTYTQVLGIQQYQNLKEDLENYLKDLKGETAGPKEKTQLGKVKLETQIAGDRIVDIDKEILDFEEIALEHKYEIDSLQEKLIQKGSFYDC